MKIRHVTPACSTSRGNGDELGAAAQRARESTSTLIRRDFGNSGMSD
jgi:hypothetical protein